ncbi:MAG: TetR/AcrR family transcriptional regulator [Caulobacterales bacterium]
MAQSAIAFFNDYGASQVSLTKLSSHLKMTRGHLQYHFATNNDLYTALFELLDKDIRDVVSYRPPADSIEAIVQHQIQIQDCLWRHRYFFRDLDFLVHADRAIFNGYARLHEWVAGELVALAAHSHTALKIHIVYPEQLYGVAAENLWLMWTSRIRWEAISKGKKEMRGAKLDAFLRRLVADTFTFLAPFAPTAVRSGLLQSLDVGLSNLERAESRTKK